jgi:hypothetical protein
MFSDRGIDYLNAGLDKILLLSIASSFHAAPLIVFKSQVLQTSS